jgi:hypothetical protein
MRHAEFLRYQADTCLRIARHCFDLASAERMRLMAGELKAKAAEIERQETIEAHIIDRDGLSTGKSRRG